MLRPEGRYLVRFHAIERPVIVRAEGVALFDAEGRRYLDFSAQHSAAVLGHAHPEMVARLQGQLRRLTGVSPAFLTRERASLAERLAETMAGAGHAYRVAFGVTGSDSVELALSFAKLARGGGPVVGLWRGFHGATAAAMAASGTPEAASLDPALRELLPGGFAHASPPYCYRCDFGASYPGCRLRCLGDLEARVRPEVAAAPAAAVVAEPILAGGGVVVPPPGYLAGLRTILDQAGTLLILDEVVTGMGRTGTLWAWQQDRIAPDLLVAGKGLTAGYVPGSAVLVRDDVAALVEGRLARDGYGGEGVPAALHPHTHSGYPLMAAAALATLDIIQRDGLAGRAAALGDRLGGHLRRLRERHPCIGDVRGRGLLWGLELIATDPTGRLRPATATAASLYDACLDRGLLVEVYNHPLSGSAVLALHPPLVVEDAQVDEAAAILDEALASCQRS